MERGQVAFLALLGALLTGAFLAAGSTGVAWALAAVLSLLLLL